MKKYHVKPRGARFFLVVLIAVVAMIAAACSSSSDTTTTQETGGEGSTTTAAGSMPDLSGQSVEVAAVWSGNEQANFQKVLDQFASDTGASVTFTSTGDDIATVLGTSIEGGSPPTVAILPQPGLLNELASKGSLTDIGPIAGDLVDQNYAPVWRDLGSVDGTLYGVWFKAANKSTVWYNTQLFDDAGATVPATWDDFLTQAKKISDSGITPVSVGGADGWTLTDWFENVYLRTAGPDMYDQLTTNDIQWTDQSVKDALSKLADVFGDPALLSGGVDTALQNGFVPSVTRVFGDSPEAAIVYEGDFVAGVISDETNSVVGTDALFFAFPSIDGSEPSVVGGGDVAVLLDDTPAGQALIQYLATPEAAEIWASNGGFCQPQQGC